MNCVCKTHISIARGCCQLENLIFVRLKEAIHISIKSRRIELGMTQAELAKVLGVDQSAVHLWENGIGPKRSRLPEIADALKCSTDELLRREDTA